MDNMLFSASELLSLVMFCSGERIFGIPNVFENLWSSEREREYLKSLAMIADKGVIDEDFNMEYRLTDEYRDIALTYSHPDSVMSVKRIQNFLTKVYFMFKKGNNLVVCEKIGEEYSLSLVDSDFFDKLLSDFGEETSDIVSSGSKFVLPMETVERVIDNIGLLNEDEAISLLTNFGLDEKLAGLYASGLSEETGRLDMVFSCFEVGKELTKGCMFIYDDNSLLSIYPGLDDIDEIVTVETVKSENASAVLKDVIDGFLGGELNG